MFSASQQAQGGSPWAQKTTATPFGSQAGMQFGNPSMGASPATPAHGQPGLLQPQNAHAFTPQNRPQQQSMAPQTTPQWGQQTTLGTPQNQQNTSLFAGNAPYSPAPPQPLSAQPSPMQPGQAPVNYLPGYLSKMRGNERASSSSHRPIESASPPARDADTSLVLPGGKETQASGRAAPSASPTNRFSSSFFNVSQPADDSRFAHSPPPANKGREGSIFGQGGLRGTRKQEDPDRSYLLRAPSEPATAPSGNFFGTEANTSAMDDDDAPPADALTDVAQQAPLAFQASLSTRVAATPEKAPAETPIAQRVVLVFGFPGYLYTRVVDHFAAIGGLQKSEEVPLDHAQSDLLATTDGKPPKGALPSIARLTYSAPYQALMAVRRSGQLVANTCMIGVRWESDALHELSQIRGLDAALVGESDAKPPAPSTPAPARAPLQNKSTPLIGRPIDVVDTPISALAQKHPSTPGLSPLRAAVSAGEAVWRNTLGGTPASAAQPGAPAASKSVVGRLADGLFGW